MAQREEDGIELQPSRSRRSSSLSLTRSESESESGNSSDGPPGYGPSARERVGESWVRCKTWLGGSLNFYRIHMLVFIFTPLIFAGIMYAIDEGDHPFPDILTLCVSSVTVTGLNPILMETITHGQQAIAFLLMCIGSTSAVSLLTIVIRRQFFKARFEHMVRTDPRVRKRARDAEEAEDEKRAHLFAQLKHPFHAFEKEGHHHQGNGHGHGQGHGMGNGEGHGYASRTGTPSRSNRNTPMGSRVASSASHRGDSEHNHLPLPLPPAKKQQKKRKRDRVRIDMIRRIDEPVKVNQMNVGGFLSENEQQQRRASLDADAQGGLMGAALEPTATRTDSPLQLASVVEHASDVGGEAGASTEVAAPLGEPEKKATPPNSPRTRISIVEQPSPRSRRVSLPAQLSIKLAPPPERPGEIEEDSDSDSDSSHDGVGETLAAKTHLHPSDASGDAGRPIKMPPLRSRRSSDPTAYIHRREREGATEIPSGREFKRVRTLDPPRVAHLSGSTTNAFPRTQTIEIREPVFQRHAHSTALPHVGSMGTGEIRRRTGIPLELTTSKRVGIEPTRTMTSSDNMPRTITRQTAMTQGFGGFPNPVKIVASAARDRITNRVATLDIPRSTTLQSTHSQGGLSDFAAGPTRAVSYISFDAVVGRNSKFYSLTSAQRDELGGVEYRALSALLKIVASYYVFVQLIPMIILAPIFQIRYRYLFGPEQGTVNGAGGWYAAFNVASAYSNTGTSLLDESMVPFQRTYGYIVVISFLILAGNTAFPIFLRFSIWVLSKLTPRESRVNETLQFLLDHPRRCFIYLFPSHQTWILVFMLVVLNMTDWICFLVLDIGNSIIGALPVGTRMIDGLLQAFAVRAAGFSIVSLAETAPALQVLYVIMMYIAVYPIAMSIRSTNVYEERSMGVFHDDADDSESAIEAAYQQNHKAGSYFAHHARRQLAFDIWWLGLALWAICIVERRNIDDPATDSYFNVFTIMFELVSAYGTVGLSLGTPTANYSLCGDFRVLSKLILCAVMIRGRHRGLPVAIDRSILLPSDLEALHSTTSRERRSSIAVSDGNQEGAVSEGGSRPIRGLSSDSSIRRRAASGSSGFGGLMEGSSRPRKISSNQSQGAGQSQHRRTGSQRSNPSLSFAADGPGGKPGNGVGLGRYLSTVYSGNPDTIPEGEVPPSRDEEHILQPKGSPEQCSSEGHSGKSAFVSA